MGISPSPQSARRSAERSCLCIHLCSVNSENCCRYGQDSLLVSCRWNMLAELSSLLPQACLVLVLLEGFWLSKYTGATATAMDGTQNYLACSLLCGTDDVDVWLPGHCCVVFLAELVPQKMNQNVD